MLRTRYRAYAPSTTKLWRGICQRLTVTKSFFIFDNHFSFSGKMLASHKDFFCSSLFPLCLPSGVLLPCRDVCFSVNTSCHRIFLLHGFQWPEFLDCKKLPARPRLCLSPPSPTPLFSVPSTSSVWSTSSSPSAPSTPSVSWYYCF